jgi:gliding motility-associated-like protein
VKPVILLFVLLFFILTADAQDCTTKGQTPQTAFPVCGTTTFSQSNVPVCRSNDLYVPGCSGPGAADYANKNPYWYKFTCYKTGTLGFLITPNEITDDYDWQLYDVTGLDPVQVYTNKNIIVTGNWAGNPGTTGASASGVNYIQCASSYNGTEPRFAKMPNIIAGHQYILLVSHFTDSQSGYSLSFGGGTGSITDTLPPAVKSISTSCDATKIYVNLNKNMKCSSLAADGSDFILSSSTTKIVSATAFCGAFDMDSLVLNLSNPLPVGHYTVSIKKGTDGNTLLDNCDQSIPEGDSLGLNIVPLAPTPLDSLAPLNCAPQSLQLVLKKNILCNSVAANGSDFTVTGPANVSITNAQVNCANSETKTITINLSAPVVKGGKYQITLKNGSDGNTIIDECGEETPAGSAISFDIKDTVSADFSYSVRLGCKSDAVSFQHDGKNGVNQWLWQFDNNGKSTLQDPVAYFDSFGVKKITLQVSNGVCSDSVTKEVLLDNELNASFETNNILCPEDSAVFKNTSIGNIVSYYWNFQNGNSSNDKDPVSQKFPLMLIEKYYPIQLIVKNNLGCFDTAVNNIRVLKSCYIAVPNAFTPNGDGLNDFLYPLNAFKADQLEFKVYNRLGQLVYQSHDWTEKWDGTFHGKPQDAGVFVWTLKYILHDTGKHVFKKGSTVLIR